jgi:hypothetical protein
MTSSTHRAPVALPPLDLDAAVAALFCRFGDATTETERLCLLRRMLTCSRGLARILERFTEKAVVHYRGVHCSADMHAEVGELSHALAEWAGVVEDTATMYRQCQQGHRLHSPGPTARSPA